MVVRGSVAVNWGCFEMFVSLKKVVFAGMLTILGTGCSLGLSFDDCSSDDQCAAGEVCQAGQCERPSNATDGAMPVCGLGEVAACTCAGGEVGEQVCTAEGMFAPCDCTPIGTADGSTTEDDADTGGMCDVDADCVLEGSDCRDALCVGGACQYVDFPEGTPCGNPEDASCDAPDTCDGQGECLPNLVSNGTACDECPLGEGACACLDGVCDGCSFFALANGFAGLPSIDGWTVDGGWGLYYQTPETATKAPVVFSSLVLGTNGNRVEPYPGEETEVSSVRTPTFVMPDTLEFRSWHVDEGGNDPGSGPVDNRIIRISDDGGRSWTVVADCAANSSFPFCGEVQQRDADDWDDVFIPVPREFVDKPGILEILYDTSDDCCGEEQGWYIDDANFGTRCGCMEDDECSDFDSECGVGDCNPIGDCRIMPATEGTACGDDTSNECIGADACNSFGVCVSNDPPNGSLSCGECLAGAGECGYCFAGICPDCQQIVPDNDFEDERSVTGWVLTGDWKTYSAAPPDTSGAPPISFSTGLALGTDGNLVAPYGGMAHAETSSATSPLFILGSEVTFMSWHVDEGGNTDGRMKYDNKTIELSVDGGDVWEVLVDCGLGDPFPFCTAVTERLGDDWDAITLDTSAHVGQSAQLRFGYDTVDASSGSERGWYIDELSVPWCADTL